MFGMKLNMIDRHLQAPRSRSNIKVKCEKMAVSGASVFHKQHIMFILLCKLFYPRSTRVFQLEELHIYDKDRNDNIGGLLHISPSFFAYDREEKVFQYTVRKGKIFFFFSFSLVSPALLKQFL